MSGSWTQENLPTRPGFRSRITAAAESVASGGSGGIVAVPIVGDWGPTGEFHSVADQRDYEALYGPSANDDSFFVIGAMTGTGDADDGASEVLVYRLPISAGAAASKTQQNTTPANALTIAAKYKGTLGNSITYTIREDPTDATKNQLLVYLSGTLVEQYSETKTDIAALTASVNADSNYLTLTTLIDGVALSTVTAQALDTVAGANGTAVLGDYTSAMSAFESRKFNVFGIPKMTDGTILAALRTWHQTQNSTVQRFMLVTGGGSAESLSTALTRSAATDDNGDTVNLGRNMFTDPDGTARNTAEMVGYVTGMIAGAGAKRAITFARLPEGFALTTTVDTDDIQDAIDGGLLVFTEDAHGVRVEKGITTFVQASEDDNNPYSVFSKIKSVRTIHQIENDLTETTELEWIGKVANTDKTRDGYVGMLLSYFRSLEDANILKPGTSYVRLDETQDNTGDTLYPIYGIEMAEAIERVLAIGEVSV